MGVLFNDPDVDLEDIYWFNVLALAIEESLEKNEGLICIESIKQLDGTEFETYSCYVELHRNGFIEHRLSIWCNLFLNMLKKPDKAIQLELMAVTTSL